MSYVTWKLNGTLLHELGLKGARLTYANLQPDTLEVRHLKARWYDDPLFAYGAAVYLDRVVIDGAGEVESSVTVFRGKARRDPRFLARSDEGLGYLFTGVWDELQRRPLLQNQAVVVDPTVSTTPMMVPQGLVILTQADDGTSVSVGGALAVCVNAAIAAGVSIALGDVVGFDFAVSWDEVADLTIADAITRLLQYAPDAVAQVDYAPAVPVIHFRRRAGLGAVSIPIDPVGGPGFPLYACLDTLRIQSRPDLQVPFVSIQFRRQNTTNGYASLSVEKQVAGPGTETAENALVRTIQLAGSSFSETQLSQDCRTLPLPGALGNATLDDTLVTAASDASAFLALSKFWLRKVPALSAPGVVLKGFRNRLRTAAPDADALGAEEVPALDTSLVRELVGGAITPWMRGGGHNRKAQEQNYQVEIAYDAPVADDPEVVFRVTSGYSAGVLATNASTRSYTYQESSDSIAPEPTPEGLAASLYAALSPLQYEGAFTLIEQECSLAIRPGKVVNFTGGRAEWAAMGGVVQSVTADLDSWRTEVVFGWPEALGPADLVDVFRANRLKRPATNGDSRATGTPPGQPVPEGGAPIVPPSEPE